MIDYANAVLLVDIEWSGRVFRFASETVTVQSGDDSLLYDAYPSASTRHQPCSTPPPRMRSTWAIWCSQSTWRSGIAWGAISPALPLSFGCGPLG